MTASVAVPFRLKNQTTWDEGGPEHTEAYALQNRGLQVRASQLRQPDHRMNKINDLEQSATLGPKGATSDVRFLSALGRRLVEGVYGGVFKRRWKDDSIGWNVNTITAPSSSRWPPEFSRVT